MEKYKYNYFIEVIEEIRKNRKINIEELVDNIVSSRTYYRYYNYEQEVRLDTIYSLVKKLNISLADIVFYKLHSKEKSSYFNDFIIYLTRKKYDKCEIYYQSLLNYNFEETDYLIIIQSLLKRYEYDNCYISYNEYLDFLQEQMNLVKKLQLDTMYTNYFYILYWISFNNIEESLFEKIIKFCNENEVKKNILLYYYLIPKIIDKLISINYNPVVIKNLLNCFKDCTTFIRPDIFAVNDYYKYRAMFSYKVNEENEFKEYLYRYIMGALVIKSKKEINEIIDHIKDNYNLDYNDYIFNMTTNRLNEYTSFLESK